MLKQVVIAKILVAALLAFLLLSGTVGIASAEDSVKLFGYVTGDVDVPLKNSCVTIFDENRVFL